ncbi:MAG: GNAT family N-acetyltransferase [Tannerella sp.]|jgi:diamine N-acetyltransferase|nr:GNAT family N-acetyltransferase [Tannerella sp.]
MLLEYKNIKLRAPEPEDLDILYRWENDTALWSFGCTLIPYSRYDLKQYLSSSKDLYESKQLRLVIEAAPAGEAVGTVDLYDFDPHHRRAAVGIMIDRDHQNKGLAGNALSLFCKYAFSFLKLHQLYAYIPVDNEPSKRLFARCGFKKAGILPDWQQTDEGYKDVLLVNLITVLN